MGQLMRRIAIWISVVATLGLASAAHAATIFAISGGGDGHGIGLSQYGAYGYALHGKSYRFILAHYYQGTTLAETNPHQTVRILLAAGAASFTGANRANSETTGGVVRKLVASASYSVRALPDGTLELSGGPKRQPVGRFAAPLLVTGPAPLELAGHGAYRGALEFSVVAGAVQTVNAVGLDDYARGVIAAEMPSSWSPEALKAQAVAARTYAITSNVGGDGYQLYPDTRSQMYGGVAAETPATDAAVAATQGQIVEYDGAPATTFFFASSGGHTENVENVWLGSAPEPWLRGVPDPYDDSGGNPYYRWAMRMTPAAARQKLGSLVKGQLRGIRVTQRGVSARIVAAEVVGTRGQTAVTGPQLQSMFALMSTDMNFTTISSVRVVRPRASLDVLAHLPLPALHTVLSASPPALGGSVFPAARGALVVLQRQTRRGWRTVRHVRLGTGGYYAVSLAQPGSYRIVYAGVAGPLVSVR
jgi:SpoIID/LytB domain protein